MIIYYTILCVLPHYLEIILANMDLLKLDWIIKIITDHTYRFVGPIIHPKHFLDIKDL